MRLEDTLLEDEEADEVTKQIYNIIQSEYPLEEPDHKRHRTALELSPEHILRRKRDPTETDEEYLDRMERVNTWPAYSTAAEAKWIWRAQVVIRAMKFLCDYAGCDSFRPKVFYEYSWICLREGQGVRAWDFYGHPPPLPPKGLTDHEKAEWYYETAERHQEKILAEWHKGKELEILSGQIRLQDLLSQTTIQCIGSDELSTGGEGR
ncbi:uncharacterized protein N7473_003490 [Penicillium subrubescens]|uniref:uncharacterized protein n=1 Tax=Penicillium subrubescens TaxID=1316194 RepID=UPI0025458258|nr:uncharacterized protein N7473_003490 [Penicillium subrubescens]KAJ5906574.1 hypothetical protein N7473_003490 [Penicillium subrubescens]